MPAGGIGFLVASLVLRLGRLGHVHRIGTREGFLQRLVERAVAFLVDLALVVLIVVMESARRSVPIEYVGRQVGAQAIGPLWPLGPLCTYSISWGMYLRWLQLPMRIVIFLFIALPNGKKLSFGG